MFVLRTHERNNPDFRKCAKVNSGREHYALISPFK